MTLLELFKQVFPKCTDDNYPERIKVEAESRRFTKQQVCMFLAQTGHESGGFTRFIENLNYSKKSLMRVFPKYFYTETIADAYANRPEKIANKIYANRLGNGSACSGDGWKYRGRGPIQITGKANYRAIEYDTGIKCVDDPDILLNPYEGVKSAFWFWDKNNLSSLDDIKQVTKRINGGYNGLEERQKLYSQIFSLL